MKLSASFLQQALPNATINLNNVGGDVSDNTPHLASILGSEPECEVSIDSRTLRQGQIFIAFEGNRTDGHNYVAQAVERGAEGVTGVERSASSRFGKD